MECYCGSGRHWRKGITRIIVLKGFRWHDLRRDVKKILQFCINCIISPAGDRTPHPLSTALPGQEPNKVIQMAYLYMGKAEDCYLRYLSILEDDARGYTRLLRFASPASKEATRGRSRRIAAFQTMICIVADRGSHFVAEVMKWLTKKAGMNPHLAHAYCTCLTALLRG